MILEMKVPSPGESISEVEIAEWLVKDGDFVEKDQTIAEVDSDKATLDLPAEESGIITLKAEEGDAVAVGQVVCLIDTSAKAPKKNKVEKKEKAVEVIKSVEKPKDIVVENSFAKGTPSPAASKILSEKKQHKDAELALNIWDAADKLCVHPGPLNDAIILNMEIF